MIWDEAEGAAYRVVDAHTHWSKLLRRVTLRWPLVKLLRLVAIHELLDHARVAWPRERQRHGDEPADLTRARLFERVQDAYHLDACVVLPIFAFDNELVLEMAARSPNRVVGFVNLNPMWSEAKFWEMAKKYDREACAGVKLAPHFQKFHFSVHQEAVERVFQWADESRPKRLVLAHTGSHSDVRDLACLARAHPEVPLVLGHSGLAPQVDQAVQLAREHPNAYLETSGQPYIYKLEEAARDPDVGVERLLYGSDLPTLHPRVEQAKLLGSSLSGEEKRLVFAGNLERLLRTRRP
ncbi:MAG: hypothetical protein Kow0069_20780 [Promethearchaeota archaeon]